MKKKSKKPKCDCADVIGRNQVCDICQDIKEPYRWEGESCIKITEYPKHSWELYPFCNDKYVTITLPKAPNIFYRWMMTLFFGFRWKRVK
jgi:hypothetical protein